MKLQYRRENPALDEEVLQRQPSDAVNPMTLQGVAVKSFVILGFCVAGAMLGWWYNGTAYSEDHTLIWPVSLLTFLFVGVFGMVWEKIVPFTGPVAAFSIGIFLGGMAKVFESEHSYIVIQALGLTASIFMAMMIIYLTRLIKPTQNFRIFVTSALSGILIYYVLNVMAKILFGIDLPLVNSNSIWGIIFTIVTIVFVSLSLVLDFDFVERCVKRKVPKYMEWYAAFGLFFTLIWLYLEIMRLLGKGRGR